MNAHVFVFELADIGDTREWEAARFLGRHLCGFCGGFRLMCRCRWWCKIYVIVGLKCFRSMFVDVGNFLNPTFRCRGRGEDSLIFVDTMHMFQYISNDFDC